MRSALKAVKNFFVTSWLIVGCALIVFVILNKIAAKILSNLDVDDFKVSWTTEYGNEKWMAEYLSEFKDSYATRWESYVYWRRKPFSGKHINIDDQGVRRTWAPTQTSPGPIRQIFIFGGSTAWGTGARDENTIPSLFAKLLSASGTANTAVTNYGESGYVSTQEIILLTRLLQAGKIPDVAIFYDGFNDVFSAFQNGKAGLPQNEERRRREFKARNLDFESYVEKLTQLHLLRLTKYLFARSEDFVQPKDPKKLADEVAAIYGANIQLVQSLAKQYGFEFAFLLQPNLFFKSNKTAFEQTLAQRKSYIADFYAKSYGAIRALKPTKTDKIYDISDILNLPQGLYLDECHTTEQANALIANAIFQRFNNFSGHGNL